MWQSSEHPCHPLLPSIMAISVTSCLSPFCESLHPKGLIASQLQHWSWSEERLGTSTGFKWLRLWEHEDLPGLSSTLSKDNWMNQEQCSEARVALEVPLLGDKSSQGASERSMAFLASSPTHACHLVIRLQSVTSLPTSRTVAEALAGSSVGTRRSGQ